MSRVDRLVARHQEATRTINLYQKLRSVRDATTGKVEQKRVPHHVQGNQWWRLRLADLVERRTVDVKPNGHSVTTYAPRPKRERPAPEPTMTTPPTMAPRPRGMTRQVQRALYRKACKAAGVPWRNTYPRKASQTLTDAESEAIDRDFAALVGE